MFNLNTTLKKGSHKLPSEGSCAMEVAALAHGFEWRKVDSASDLPDCMSRVIGTFVIGLNDAMPDDDRQKLMAFIPRLGATRGTKDEEQARAKCLAMNAAKPAAVWALRSCGLYGHADTVEAATTLGELEAAADAAARAAWAARAADAADAAARAARVARAADAAAWAAADAAAWAAADAASWAAWAARAAADAASWAARAANLKFDWSPYLTALDMALQIGPQADALEQANVERCKKILEAA